MTDNQLTIDSPIVREIFKLGFKAGGGTHPMDCAFLFKIYEDEIKDALRSCEYRDNDDT